MLIRTLAGLFIVALEILAQSGGSVTGKVVDVSGDPVPNAEIQATNAQTKAVFKATASSAGVYQFAQLPAGTYDLSNSSPGFTPFVQHGVVVAAGQTLQMNLRLNDFQLNTLGDGRDILIDRNIPHPAPVGPTPRMPDGKPDLSGVWHNQRTIDGGKPELKPWAEAVVKERVDANSKDAPQVRCLPMGILISGTGTPFRTVQTAKYMAMLFELDVPGYRQIYLDGRAHPHDFDPNWTGHSIGHWDGETLVVDTVGFNDKSWLPNQVPHTEKMHVIERLRRPDLGHLEIEITVEDPDAFVKPWIIKRVTELAPNDEVSEGICVENERDTRHMVGK